MKIETDMTQTYEFITPEEAARYLATNPENRTISDGTVQAYMSDINNNNWTEKTGDGISIDENGILRNGQHRLLAIVKSGIGVRMWVCRGVSSKGIYDNNRKRSNSDQVQILRTDFDNVYKSTRYIAVARALVTQGRRKATPQEIINFTDKHKSKLDEFFLVVPQSPAPKVSRAVVYLSLFMAFCGGVTMKDILCFLRVLSTGMSTTPVEFPIIAYRNYLLDAQKVETTNEEIGRCQYALKNYLSGSCIRRSISPKKLIYPFPYTNPTD